jgi:hypothetical protein
VIAEHFNTVQIKN